MTRGALLVTCVATLGCSNRGGHAGADTVPRASSASVRGGESVEVVTDCSPARRATGAVQVTADLTYATVAGRPLRLDLARPASGGPHPLVLLIHGGGWEGGSKSGMHDEMLELARRGYVTASVEYRLAHEPGGGFPAAVQDVRCAVRWLRANAGSYAIDAGRVAAMGVSAGGHLASMLGAAADVRALEGGCAPSAVPVSVNAVVSYAGPQDLRVRGPYTQEQARLVTGFLGVFPGDAPEVAALASPIAHVGAGAPPFLLVHGTEDDLVPVEHARRMAAALRAAGGRATVLELRGRGHEFVGLATSADPRVRCTTLAFLERWLRSS